MNCPGHVQIFKNGLKSYRDLPLKIAEFGKVHRFEPSGALHGLMRVRAFTQDDAHVFITEAQIAEELLKINDLILSIYEDFGFDDVRIKFSDRPDKRIGDDAVWDKAEAALMAALESEQASVDARTRARAPSTGRSSNTCCATPSAATGSAARCRSISIFRAASARSTSTSTRTRSSGDAPPRDVRLAGALHRRDDRALCRAPAAVAVAGAGGGRHHHLGRRRLRARRDRAPRRRAGLRVEGDLRNEKINYKVREHSLAKVPVLLVVGRKEAAERTVSIRRLGKEGQQVMPLDAALKMLADEAIPPDVRRVRQAA